MTAHQANRLFQTFVVMARMSHCTIEFPIDANRAWSRSGGQFLPFDLIFAGDRPLIAVDWTQNGGIDAGDELVAIGGTSMEELLQDLFRLVPGENDQAKRASLETGGLWSHYWYAFGDFEPSPVRVRKRDGRVVVLDVLGIDIDRYRSLGDTLSEPELMKDGRDFRFIGDIAYLRPGAFMSLSSSKLSEKETRGNTEFLSFLESAFTEIASSNCDHLIVDIRGNPGGSSSFSNPMIAYFADRQFHETSSLDIRTSRITKKSWREIEDPTLADLKQEILTRRDGERWSEVAEPYPPRNDELSFTGQVYGLIDRFS